MNRLSLRRVTLIAVAVLLCWSSATTAHEFWLEPTAFNPATDKPIGVRLCVGDGFEGWSLARNPQRIVQFIASGPTGEQAIVGLDGSDPAGIARLAAPGGYVIVYRSNPAFTELPPEKFEAYLKDKGLEKIVALRQKRGESHNKAREAYSRHAKALVRVGTPAGAVVDRIMGLRLELVAEPDLLLNSISGAILERAEDLHSFRLLYEGKPLAGALVVAARPGTADSDLTVRTNAEGRANFRLSEAGMWRVSSVHMIEAPRNVAAEWESLWASLTFELPTRLSTTDPVASRSVACRNRIALPALQVRQ